jgi:hypothetical protein
LLKKHEKVSKNDMGLAFFPISRGIVVKTNIFTILYKDLINNLLNVPLFLFLLCKNVDSDIPEVGGVQEN